MRQSYHISPGRHCINLFILNIVRIIRTKDEKYQGPSTEQPNTQFGNLRLQRRAKIDSTHFR